MTKGKYVDKKVSQALKDPRVLRRVRRESREIRRQVRTELEPMNSVSEKELKFRLK